MAESPIVSYFLFIIAKPRTERCYECYGTLSNGYLTAHFENYSFNKYVRFFQRGDNFGCRSTKNFYIIFSVTCCDGIKTRRDYTRLFDSKIRVRRCERLKCAFRHRLDNSLSFGASCAEGIRDISAPLWAKRTQEIDSPKQNRIWLSKINSA